MATIGKNLNTPESGWKRIDHTDTNIIYTGGAWTSETNSTFYGGSQYNSTINGATIEFNVKSTRVRIISSLWTASVSSSSVDVYVDDVFKTNITQVGASVRQGLFYEVSDLLPDESHKIKLVNKTSLVLNLDAIDIDENGEMLDLNYVLKPIRRLFLKNTTSNQYYSLAEKTLIPLPDTSKNMILHGIGAGKEIKLDGEFDKINYPVEGTVVKITVKPLSIKFE